MAFAADMIALAVCEIGSLAERRIAMLVDPALSGLPAFLTPKPGLNSGFMIPQVTAAALVSENKQRAYPASVDSIPTSANQEDHVSMAAHGARRLLADGRERRRASSASSCWPPRKAATSTRRWRRAPPLEAVRALVRAEVPHLDDDRYFHPDMEAAIALVRSGARHRGGRRGSAAVDLGSLTMTDLARQSRAGTAPLLVVAFRTPAPISPASTTGWSRPGSAATTADW